MKRKNLTTAEAEPTRIRGVIVAVLTLLAGLGFTWAGHVSKETISAVVVIAGVVIPLLQAEWTRRAVTANAKVVTQVTSDGDVVAGDAAVAPTGSPVGVNMVLGVKPVLDEVIVKPHLLRRAA